MKKQKEVGIEDIITNETAWADLILSKTALILATAIILTAVYSLSGTYSDLAKKDELEAIAVGLMSNINSAGSARPGADDTIRTYYFDINSGKLADHENLNVSVSCEYVVCTLEDRERNISAVRPLCYSTLPFTPGKVRSILTERFAASGNISQPVNSVFPYADVTEFLAMKGTEELFLNMSKEVHIQKTSVFVTDGSKVNELEYILVYQ